MTSSCSHIYEPADPGSIVVIVVILTIAAGEIDHRLGSKRWMLDQNSMSDSTFEAEALTMTFFGEMIHSIALTVTRLVINLQLSVFCSVAESCP